MSHHDQLDETTLDLLTWKSVPMRNAAVAILESFLRGKSWPDQIDMSGVGPSDKNCIGIAWRWLARYGIITRTNEVRRSESPDAKGRFIFRYRLADERLARTFLARQGRGPVEKRVVGQLEMGL